MYAEVGATHVGYSLMECAGRPKIEPLSGRQNLPASPRERERCRVVYSQSTSSTAVVHTLNVWEFTGSSLQVLFSPGQNAGGLNYESEQ